MTPRTITRRTVREVRAKAAHHATRLEALVATIHTRADLERIVARMPPEFREAARAELMERVKGRIDGV